MYIDLAQISKSKGIYQTLSLLAILSAKQTRNRSGKYPVKNEDNEAERQANAGNAGNTAEPVISGAQKEINVG
jgi:hypothetical protein